ncbi:hypothetical protein ACKWTF_012661 [Chironomus riparius]
MNCFKTACAGNTIYPYSLWKLQCVNDFSFTSFCSTTETPMSFKQCPSAKAQMLNACLDYVFSLVSSLQPSADLNMILDDTKRSYDAVLDEFSATVEIVSSF